MANEFDDILGESTKSEGSKQFHSGDSTHSPHTTKPIEQNDIDTYSDEEIFDVNAIITNISDTSTPIAVFFGPASSGKTMTLLRMIRFFQADMGYTVRADRTFRPSHDRHYKKMCDTVDQMANSNYAPKNNDTISFMLVTVYDKGGSPIMQILEAPGEHYFDPNLPSAPFPSYIQRIINSIPNRKIWVYFVEQDWKDQQDRNNYAGKITSMQALTPHDKVLFLFNKCDNHMHQYDTNGRPRKELYLRTISQQYPGIFTRYMNDGFAKLLFGPYKFTPVCFSSGAFSSTADGRQVWNVGPKFYCEDLWKILRG